MILVQARMGSTRLPGKVLMPLAGRPMVIRVLKRAAMIGPPVVLATSTDPRDDELAATVARYGFTVSRGSEEDVLDRFVSALPEGARSVARVTADCPLLDPWICRGVLAAVRAGGIDFVSNALVPSFPDGLDCEAFTVEALRSAWAEARRPSEREHVTPFIWNRPDRFRLWAITRVPDLSHERWTVDDARDLEFVRRIYELLPESGDEAARMEAVLAVLAEHPELRAINAGTQRNEGYRRSLERDRAAGFDERDRPPASGRP